ncbi:MAG: hypothetical protein A2231_12420 [Candidatus Firestonebacteria bacterium RIFOXYA2_FULL_40_8]|nr:MAG: hypothetical protein A2231_12420 [Candidatus Firestonebacteria bacterium RIFOXYA2_FULL_40_8]HLD31833.1 DNA recombination protein RmuC [Patescibacteria group bacterium]
MDLLLWKTITILSFLAFLVTIIYVLFRRSSRRDVSGDSILMLQTQIQDLSRTIDQKISETSRIMTDTQVNLDRTIRDQYSHSSRIITDVTEKLTKLDETNRQVIGFADQLQTLEDTLKNPKHRGILGEYYLETVLKNVLPPSSYQMQYRFSDGMIVDAVVFVKEKIIPIDSKFSLENYNRILEEKNPAERENLEKEFKVDLKKRIEETSKYIRPQENTMDFAFMFLPAEGVYYDLLINKVGAVKVNTHDLIEYAFREKHVIIVSPTSFFAYLQTVLQGLRALQIEESAKEIREQVEKLGRHLLTYEEYLRKLGTNLSTSVNFYNRAYKEFGKIDKDVLKITGEAGSVEVLQIENPTLDQDS